MLGSRRVIGQKCPTSLTRPLCSRKKQGAPPVIAAPPPPPHAMLRGCGACCACSASGFWPVPLPQARSRMPVRCICCAGMLGFCMMPGWLLARVHVLSVLLLAAERVRVRVVWLHRAIVRLFVAYPVLHSILPGPGLSLLILCVCCLASRSLQKDDEDNDDLFRVLHICRACEWIG